MHLGKGVKGVTACGKRCDRQQGVHELAEPGAASNDRASKIHDLDRSRVIGLLGRVAIACRRLIEEAGLRGRTSRPLAEWTRYDRH